MVGWVVSLCDSGLLVLVVLCVFVGMEWDWGEIFVGVCYLVE